MDTSLVTYPLQLTGFVPGTALITKEGEEAKKLALDTAKLITVITCPEDEQKAKKALDLLKDYRIDVDKAFKFYKDPVNKVGKELDRLKGEAMTGIEEDEGRIKRAVGDHRRREDDKAEKARQAALRAQQEIEDRAKRDAQAAQKLLDDAEKLRQQQALAATPKEKAKLEQQATALEEDADDALLKAESAALAAPVAPTFVAAPKTKGISYKAFINFEVIDPIVMLEAHEQFWKPKKNGERENEILQLDRQAVIDQLNLPKGIFHTSRFPEDQPGTDGLPKIPGCRVFSDSKVGSR